MEFTLAGKRFNIAPQDIVKAVQGVEPEPIQKHAVKIGERLYPVKQVLSIATGLTKADINSHHAHQILRWMGLNVVTGKGRL